MNLFTKQRDSQAENILTAPKAAVRGNRWTTLQTQQTNNGLPTEPREPDSMSCDNLYQKRPRKIHVCALSCLTHCNPLDCGPSGSSVHGIFQARILEWLLFPIPGVLLDPRIKPHLLHLLNRQADSLWLRHLGNSYMYVCIYNYV